MAEARIVRSGDGDVYESHWLLTPLRRLRPR